MKILTKDETLKQKREQARKARIEKICEAFVKGVTDYSGDLEHRNIYQDKNERAAYTYGWNRR